MSESKQLNFRRELKLLKMKKESVNLKSRHFLRKERVKSKSTHLKQRRLNSKGTFFPRILSRKAFQMCKSQNLSEVMRGSMYEFIKFIQLIPMTMKID